MQLSLPFAESVLPGLPPPARQIYCSRNLRLDQVELVGFDMDYTLAIYNQPEIDRLSVEATLRKLLERGYPEVIGNMPYRTDFPIRGLLIDKKLGNVLKMDRHRYVKKAYHGMCELHRDERRSLYHRKQVRPGTPRYHWVDTLYALCEVTVFCAAVAELERVGTPVDYERLFNDIRECIDVAHQDGSILDIVRKDFNRFVLKDSELSHTLHKLRSAGKKLFLLTNSRASYTEEMMTHLLGDGTPKYPSWRHYFDFIITEAAKPRFFTHPSPFMVLSEQGVPQPATGLERGKIYVGGWIGEFERLTGFGGDCVLYVGDHIYGDVLRTKKESAWRTAMIIQEMADELRALGQSSSDLRRLEELEQTRDALYTELRIRQAEMKELQRRAERPVNPLHPRELMELETERTTQRRIADRIRAMLKTLEDDVTRIEHGVDQAFHPFWGSLFKAGAEVSNFGAQVESYACLYTDRVTNFGLYSPMHYFRSPRDLMPHEM